MPIDYSQYHPKWKLIRRLILKRANHCCEGSEAYPDCRVANYTNHPATGSRVILTVGHVDQDIDNNRFSNLRAWCQRCHLKHDQHQHAMSRKYGKDWKKNQLHLKL